MLLIWGQKWGRYRRYYYGLPLRRNLKPRASGVFGFWFPGSGATPTGGQRKKINIPLVSLAL